MLSINDLAVLLVCVEGEFSRLEEKDNRTREEDSLSHQLHELKNVLFDMIDFAKRAPVIDFSMKGTCRPPF